MENILYTKFLNSIYQCTKMILQTYDDIIPSAEGSALKDEASIEQRKFSVIANECEILARSEKLEIKDNSWFEKAKKWTGDKLSALLDKSDFGLVEILVEGVTLGASECENMRVEFAKVDNDLMDLLGKLQALCEESKNKLNVVV